MKFIAFVTKGLEEISVDELKSLKGLTIISNKQKVIEFEYGGELESLKTLRTVDDVGLYISEISVERLLKLELDTELEKIRESMGLLCQYRNIDNRFSITVSKYKNKVIREDYLKQILATYFSSNLNLTYTPLDHSNLDIRVNIVEEKCLITIKVFSKSLFRRDYEHETQLGSLRSTIAASMLYRLIIDNQSLNVVDNFCGSGTFLCEALIMDNKVYGSDIDKFAVETTIKNLDKIRREDYQITCHDASKTRWNSNYFDIAVSNFPWDKQVKVDRMNELIDNALKEYARVLKKDSKIGLITTKPDVVIKYLKKYFVIKNLKKYKIGYLGQVPTIVLASVNKL